MFSDDSITLANLAECKCDLPCSDELWNATEQEWQEIQHPPLVWFPSAMTSLLQGSPVYEDLSSFAILCLLGGILTHIATYERLSWYKPPCSDQTWTTSMLSTLHAWENTWKRHPHANPNPYNDTHGPLMADAIPLLNTAYFHIYAPRLLQRIKDNLAVSLQHPDSISRETFHGMLMPQSDVERDMLFRAAAHATHSLQVRARLGFNLVARSACLDSAFHYAYTGFESGLPSPGKC